MSGTSAARWDFTAPVSGGAALRGPDGFENPFGFEFVEEGEEKEREWKLRCKTEPPEQQSLSPLAKEALARQLWEISISPAKAFLTNGIMLYLGGGSGIFGILILVYALHSCVRTLLGLRRHFLPFDGKVSQLKVVAGKCAFALQCLLFGAYLVRHAVQLGALPVHSGDFRSLAETAAAAPSAVIGFF